MKGKELLDDTDHSIKGDPHLEGDWDCIRCPSCGKYIEEVWDYHLRIYKSDDMDEIQCPHCERPIMVVWGDCNDLYTCKKQPGRKNAHEQFQDMLVMNRDSLSKHYLEKHVDHPHIQAWYLKQDAGRCMSTYLIFSTEGIIITGDLCPGPHGGGVTSVSYGGYSVGWFSGRLSHDYLCEKFPDVKLCTSDHAWLVAIQEKFAEQKKAQDEDDKGQEHSPANGPRSEGDRKLGEQVDEDGKGNGADRPPA